MHAPIQGGQVRSNHRERITKRASPMNPSNSFIPSSIWPFDKVSLKWPPSERPSFQQKPVACCNRRTAQPRANAVTVLTTLFPSLRCIIKIEHLVYKYTRIFLSVLTRAGMVRARRTRRKSGRLTSRSLAQKLPLRH